MPIAAGLNSLGGIVRNNIARFTRANTSPRGGGSRNSIPSGRNSSRGQRASSGYTPPSFSQRTRGGGTPPWSLPQSSPRGNLRYSPYDNSSNTPNPYRRPTTPPSGTNTNINTRGTAFSRGLGGSGIPRATPTGAVGTFPKGGIYGLAAYIFVRILLGNQELSSGTLPEHLRQPGEQELFEEGEKPPWYGGQNPNTGYRFVYQTAIISGGQFQGWTGDRYWGLPQGTIFPIAGLRLLSGGVDYGQYFHWSFRSRSNSSQNIPEGGNYGSYKPQLLNANGNWITIFTSNSNGIKVIGFEPADGSTEADPYAGVPGGTTATKTESTTNNSAPPPERATLDNPPPPGIRPPLPKDRTASPTPSSRYNRPRPRPTSQPKPSVVKKAVSETPRGRVESNANNNNSPEPEQPRLEAPTEIPEPIPVPEPPSEPTIEEVEQGELTEAEEPNIISERSQLRADGTRETVTTREATPQEMTEYRRRLNKAREVNEEFRREEEQTVGDEIREASERIRREIFGDPLPESRRFPFGKPDWYKYKPSSVPSTNDEDFPVPSNRNASNLPPLKTKVVTATPPPEPDEPEKEKTPFVPPPPVKQNPTTECKGCSKKILDKLGGLNTALQGADLLLVQQIHSTVHHPEHGLAKIQGFAKTAWKVTKADKIMSGVTMALTVHNAMMLSNNLASTISEALNMSLNALGIRDETDNPIDIGAAVRGKITEVMSSVLGAENYAALTTRIAKANRIYQASINLLDTTYSLFDSARTVAELTAENTGKIGNALRESGAVYEDAYDEFLEKVNPQNASHRRLDKFREGLESVENVFDTATQISGSVVDFRENINQLKEEGNNLTEEINTQTETQKEEKNTAKIENQVTTEIADNDFDRGTAQN